jgi:hypothetical protein
LHPRRRSLLLCVAAPQVALTEALDQVYDMAKKEITITF